MVDGTPRSAGGRPDAGASPDKLAALSDLELVAAYRAGDAGAFDRIFSRYNDRIRILCRRYVGSGPAAEDMVQETFYRVVRSVDRIEGETFNVSAWIHRIAVNLCRDELRRRGRATTHVEPSSDALDERIVGLVDSNRDHAPEAALEATTLRGLVRDVAGRLPERQRRVLTLRELEGLSYGAIAEAMGTTDSAVETLLHRARRRFRDEYLLLDGEADQRPGGRCAAVEHLLGHTRHAGLRRDQREFVRRHLRECAACRERHPQAGAELLAETGGDPHAEAVATAVGTGAEITDPPAGAAGEVRPR